MRVFLPAACFLLLLPVATARAAAPTCSDAELKARVAEARKAFGQGRFEDSAAGYEAAYACKTDPAHLFNLANARAELKQWAEASRVMARFLDSPGLNADVKAEAKRSHDDMLTHVGTLTVTSEVAGAEVEVAGKAVGKAPLEGYLVDAGSLEVRVLAPGKPLFREKLEVAPGKPLRVRATWRVEPPPPSPPAARQPAWWSWVGFGAAGAFAITGGVTGGLSLSQTEDLKKLCVAGACPASSDGARDEANALANASNVLLPLAAAALAVGIAGVIVGEPRTIASIQSPNRQGVTLRWLAPLSLGGTF